MNEEGQQQDEQIEPGAANAPEGAVEQPTEDEVGKMYSDLGIKATPPTDKSKKRSEANDGGNKKTAKKDDGGSKPDGKKGDDDGKDKPKASSSSDSDGGKGDASDSKSEKVSSKDGKDGKEDGKVSEPGKTNEEGVSKTESSDNEDSSKSGKKEADDRSEGTGQESDESKNAQEEGKDDEGKRPGKSNPEVERRFQKFTSDIKDRDAHIEKLEKQLEEKNEAQAKAKVQQEDPEYTVEDFRKVRDREGNIVDLDPERAELAWRRWKEGYDQRGAEREAKATQERAKAERESEANRQLMKQSVEAYDALTQLQSEYPELVSTNKEFDADFAAEAMPIIEEAIDYMPGTEPGNKDGKLPIITGMRIDPKKILNAMKKINTKKRNLPLNGVNDNVESRPNVSVPHTRSSDPNVNAANDLYKSLGINKRI